MRFVCLILLAVAPLGAQSQAVLSALATGTYFPLDVGDRWVYREDTRTGTATYQTWRIDRTETVNGFTYSVYAIEGPGDFYGEQWFRADSAGRVYLYTGAPAGALFLDPTVFNSTAGIVQLTGKGGDVKTDVGTFPDTVTYRNPMGLESETGILARGVGVLSSLTTMLSGSSGGPTLIRTLVEADLAGGAIHFPAVQPGISLGIESLTLDVSGGHVTNCAIPCYFVACYLAGADPPGTYKPCARTRVELRDWPANASRTVTLTLQPSAFTRTVTLDAPTFLQLPLYTAPNQPLPPGMYQLTAKTKDGAAQSTLEIQIN